MKTGKSFTPSEVHKSLRVVSVSQQYLLENLTMGEFYLFSFLSSFIRENNKLPFLDDASMLSISSGISSIYDNCTITSQTLKRNLNKLLKLVC